MTCFDKLYDKNVVERFVHNYLAKIKITPYAPDNSALTTFKILKIIH